MSPASWMAAGALAFFVAAACLFIPQLGIEEDEVHFVPSIYDARTVGSVKVWGHRFPTMIETYAGAAKTYLYTPIIKAIRPTLWSLRLPVVMAGALFLWLLFVATTRLTNDLVAAALVWVIATDPVFLLTTTFDWGPVALQHLLIIAAFAFLARSKPMVFMAFMAFGLAWWDKGTAAWVSGALFVSAIVFMPGPVMANVTFFNAMKAVCGFAAGALPFFQYNIWNHWATFNDNARLSIGGLPEKFRAMWATLDGRGMFGYIVRGGTPLWYSLAPLGIAAALALLLHRRVAPVRPVALFALSTGLLTWTAMLLTANGGGSVHHIILVWPWPHLFAVCVLGYALKRKPFVAAATAIAISNIVMIGWYAQRTYQFSPTSAWSDASFGLPGVIPANRKIVTIDWGIDNAATFLTRGGPVIDRTFSGLADSDVPDIERSEFLAHAPGEEMIAGNNARFDAAIGKLGFMRVTDHIVADRRGRPFFISFHCVPKPAGS
jgi:hypothetical protein